MRRKGDNEATNKLTGMENKKGIHIVKSGEPACQVCNATGHVASGCPSNNRKIEQTATSREPIKDTTKNIPICENCGKLGHSIDKCFKLHPPPDNKFRNIGQAPSLTVCQVCDTRGHTADRCFKLFPPNDKPQGRGIMCQLCKEQGHTANNCSQLPRNSFPLNQGQVPQDLRYPVPTGEACQICKRSGHKADTCRYRTSGQNYPRTQKPFSGPPQNLTCHKCKMPGHFIRDCPNHVTEEWRVPHPQGNGNGLPGTGTMREAQPNMCPVRTTTTMEPEQ